MAKTPKNPLWTYEQTLVAFRVYLNTSYGRLNQSNAELEQIGNLIGRSQSALIMKCCNFASMDPFHAARGVKGLPNKSGVEKQIWREFHEDSDTIVEKMEAVWDRISGSSHIDSVDAIEAEPVIPSGPHEVDRVVRTRRLQGAFRRSVMVGYKNRCALTGLGIPALLNASHIIPWAKSENRCADPRNGLCLNVLHDRAFDRGLLSFDEDLRAIVAPGLSEDQVLGDLVQQLKGIEGKPLAMPERFGPLPEAMAFHREHIFKSS